MAKLIDELTGIQFLGLTHNRLLLPLITQATPNFVDVAANATRIRFPKVPISRLDFSAIPVL